MRAPPDLHAPPYSATHGDVTHIILVCLIVGLLSFLVIGWVVRFQFQWAVLLSRSGVILIALGALALAARGSVRWSARLLIWGLWCANLEIVGHNGGLHAPQILAFPVDVALAAWLLGRRETITMAVLTGLALLSLLGLEQSGALPPPRSNAPFVLTLLVFGNLTIATAAALLSRASYLRQCADLQRSLDTLRQQEAEQFKLLRLLDQCPMGLAITDAAHRLDYLNETLALNRGVQRAAWQGCDVAALNHRGLTLAQQTELAQAQARGQPWHGEQFLPGPQGQPRTESLDVLPLRDAQGHISHWFELSQDTSDRRWAAEQIARLAYLDPATQLPNRAALLDHLHAARQGGAGREALLLFRLCGLRARHDALGPAASEQTLREVADALRRHLPESARPYRLGGGTFAVRLQQLPQPIEAAFSAAEREIERWHPWLQRPLAEVLPPPDQAPHSLHLGATLYPWLDDASEGDRGLEQDSEHDSPSACLQRASLALSQARAKQAPRVCWGAPQQVRAEQQRQRGQAEWQGAAARGQWRLLLQGQYDTQGRRVGLAAELRWAHPLWGLLPRDGSTTPPRSPWPALSDHPSALDDWGLEQLALWWHRHPGTTAGLKLTLPWQGAWQGGHEAASSWLQRLQSHGLGPEQLRLAIPTRHLGAQQLADPALLSPLHLLRHAGFGLSLQDLGPDLLLPGGLQGWPIEGVHLSPALLQAVPGSQAHTALLAGVVSVCLSQGLRVVVQGVDTEGQRQALQAMSGDLVLQGDWLSPALLASDWPPDSPPSPRQTATTPPRPA